MGKRSTPGLNTSSMADISFLLLTFFLMTSSINTDMGIARRLPPPLQQDMTPPEVHKRNVMKVNINFNDVIIMTDPATGALKRDCTLPEVKEMAKEFLSNPHDLSFLPEKETRVIDGFPGDGTYRVSQAVISLTSDRGTSYETYFHVQNQLAAAINELRDELSLEVFHKHYADLNDAQTEAIGKAIPVPISEAEPKNIGGTR